MLQAGELNKAGGERGFGGAACDLRGSSSQRIKQTTSNRREAEESSSRRWWCAAQTSSTSRHHRRKCGKNCPRLRCATGTNLRSRITFWRIRRLCCAIDRHFCCARPADAFFHSLSKKQPWSARLVVSSRRRRQLVTVCIQRVSPARHKGSIVAGYPAPPAPINLLI